MNKLFRFSFKRLFAIALIFLLFFNFFMPSAVSDFEGRPDLKITYVDFPDEVNEDEEVKFVVEVKNSINSETGEYGNISSGEIIWVSLKVDNVRVSTSHYDYGLDVSESCYINLTWDAELGTDSERQILIEVDYNDTIPESDENNNDRPGVITIYEKDTDLAITDVDMPEIFFVNNSYVIFASVINDGAATDENIVAFLNSSVEGPIEKLVCEDALEKDEVFVFSFNWTPSTIGTQTLTINIVYSGETHDSYSASVFVRSLYWWNESWHYRYFMSVKGSGNFSKTFNFTSLLEELGVYQGVFENETIRVVQYSSEGDIIDDSVNHSFNENSDYNSTNNANGSLLWNVVSGSSEKFYCIYFDVASNDGIRPSVPEYLDMNSSGSVTVKYDGFVEGWSFEIIKPVDDSYVFVNDLINISVDTEAIAKNVEVFVFLNENESNNKTLYLDSTDGISWSSNTTLDVLGNWTFIVKSSDAAGFTTFEKDRTIFVGKPDLTLSNVSIKTSWTPTSPKVYVDDDVYLTASIFCSFATVGPANVKMSVYNESVEVYSNVKTRTFEKNEYTNVSFEWDATSGGDFTFKFFVDPDNLIDEVNESNNEFEQNFTVYYWPDLVINSISWETTTIMAYDKVKFTVEVENIGLGDADSYDLKLFIKPSSQKTIEYTSPVYTKKINVSAGDEKEFSLFWNSAESGSWYVAAKVFLSDTKKDVDTDNNYLFVTTNKLVVNAIETVKPVIENVDVTPSIQQQGGSIDITADVTDDTGLESVVISFYDSDENLLKTTDMIRIAGDGFKYVFSETLNVDDYTFVITAVDSSKNKNENTYEGTFEIIADHTNPSIYYVWADPMVQMLGDPITISCNAEDNVGVNEVELVLTNPSGAISMFTMKEKSGQYIYKDIYNSSGNYSYYIVARDKADNEKTSKTQHFYITRNLDDADDDEMPDWWEERYGFNPFDPKDGTKDYDNDGLTNSEEYNGGTNPHKDIVLQNVAYRVRSNVFYIVLSIAMFALLIILDFIVNKRR